MGLTRRDGHRPRPKSFDVICAGEALWSVARARGPSALASAAPRIRPDGGAVDVALALAHERLRVGLATVLTDDDFGRTCRARIAESGVDVGGVSFAPPRTGVVVVDASGGASPLPKEAEAQPPLEVPPGWSAQILLLSGLSPAVSHAAALCKAARAARRAGAFVLIDFDASLPVWAGRDPRTIRMVLREVDAARCSVADLAVLGTDVATVRAALRPSAVLVVTDGDAGAVATGPFGEVSFVPREAKPLRAAAFTAAICMELAHKGEPGESASARWHRALARGHRAATMRQQGTA